MLCVAGDAEFGAGPPVNYVVNVGFPNLLRDAIWHTTHPDRWNAICRCGEILPNPDIPDTERWKTNRGPDYFPFVRHIDGISLFDFHGFDPLEYSEGYPLSSWRTFVPVHRGWPAAIWLKVDTSLANGQFLSPKELSERQHAEGAHRHSLMPRIEAAVVGTIPIEAVVAAYRINYGSADFEAIENQGWRVAAQQIAAVDK